TRLRESFLHSDNQTAQDPDRARRPRRISRTQNGRHQILLRLLVKAQKAYHRQIAIGVVVAIEEGQLLGAVGGIIGRIQIDRDASGSAPQTTAMPFDHTVGQRFAHAKQLFAIPAIFKARQGRLRSQVFALDGIAPHQQLMDWIGTEPGRIVGIRIPASDGHHALRDQFDQLVLYFVGLPLLLQSLGESGSEVQSLIGGAQQNCPAVRAALWLIKLRDDRTRRNSWEENTLCYLMLVQAKASCWSQNRLDNGFVP